MPVKTRRLFADPFHSMAIDTNNPYFRTKVLTASPEELRLLLIDGGIRFLRLGRQALNDKNWESVYSNLSSGKDIVLELLNGLRPEIDPELCSRLTSLYTWMLVTITEAGFEKDLKKLDDVIGTLEYERETWALLMEKVAKDRAAGVLPKPAEPSNLQPHANQPGLASPQRRPLSISA